MRSAHSLLILISICLQGVGEVKSKRVDIHLPFTLTRQTRPTESHRQQSNHEGGSSFVIDNLSGRPTSTVFMRYLYQLSNLLVHLLFCLSFDCIPPVWYFPAFQAITDLDHLKVFSRIKIHCKEKICHPAGASRLD
jgi:hypothetical protein